MATTTKKASDLYLTSPNVVKNNVATSAGGSLSNVPNTYLGDGGSGGSSNSGTSTPTTDTSAVYLDEIQKAASEKNYKTLLKSDVAAYNLKMNTQKYLNNTLSSNGVNTQGYGTSAHVGAENNASQLYATNLENYNDAEATAQSEAETRATTAATENDNQLATYLQYSDGSDEQIETYMKNYGYTKQSDGTWKDASGNAPSKYILSAITSAQNNTSSTTDGVTAETQATYDSSLTGIKGAASFVNANKGYSSNSTDGYSIDDIANVTVGSKDNTATDMLKNVVGDEVTMMQNYIREKGSSAEGTLFRLERGGNSQHETYLVMYLNRKFYICSNDDREDDNGDHKSQVKKNYEAYKGAKVYYKGSSLVEPDK